MNLRIVFLVLLFTVLGSTRAQTPSLIICKGSTINYREFNSGSSLPSVSWFWTFQGGSPVASTLREPSITYPDTGLYKTACISTFSDSSKQTQEIWVLVIESVFEPIPLRDTVFCGASVALQLNAGNNYRGIRYQWTSPDVTLNAADTTRRTLNVNAAGTYSVKVYSICGSVSRTITVRQGTAPVVNLGPDRFVCRNANITLDAGAGTGYTYSWTPGGETTQSIIANVSGTYTVTVLSPDGCRQTDQINLIDSCPPVLWVPTAFTPNDAAPNDIYLPYMDGYVSIKMTIINRWGQIVFQSTDLSKGWDGTYQGKPVQEGVYACLIELMGKDSLRRIEKTNITLLR